MKINILIVDDEEPVLNSLKRMFYGSNYGIYTETSPKQALNLLKIIPIDIVISDVRIAEMNGITFLTFVKNLYPSIYRMILSGYTEDEVGQKAILTNIAFDYINKPWNEELVLKKIEYVVSIKKFFENKNLMKILNSIETIPKLENNYIEFIKAINDNKSVNILSQYITADLALSTKLIQFTNSIYNDGEKVGSIQDSLNKIGIGGLKKMIALSKLNNRCVLKAEQLEKLKLYNTYSARMNRVFSKVYYIIKNNHIPNSLALLGSVIYLGNILSLIYLNEFYCTNILSKESYESICTMELGGYFMALWNYPEEYSKALYYFKNHHFAAKNIKELIVMLKISKEYAELFNDSQITVLISTSKFDEEIENQYKQLI